MDQTTCRLTRRHFGLLSSMAAASAFSSRRAAAEGNDIALEIAPYVLEASPTHRFRTVAYNGQVPGPLLRVKQGKEVSVTVRNLSPDPEVVHWHGLFLPPEIDGAMEEGTPAIQPGESVRYRMTPEPAGFRWFHTHTMAGSDLRKAQYGGQHGFLLVESPEDRWQFDREFFVALHDWGGRMAGGDDGSMNPLYEVSTINGKMLGFGEPLRVRQGERVLLHILNSSPTEVHWLALAGHKFRVVALDGNAVPQPQTVTMLRLAPAERVCAIVETNAPGVWVLGEVRRHVRTAGMGIVLEYAGSAGEPKWIQPSELIWDYRQFAGNRVAAQVVSPHSPIPIPLTFTSKFHGHGSQESWMINGRSYPQTEEPILHAGERYRLILKNNSMDDHPMHLHRHTFEVKRVDGSAELNGLLKDVLLVRANTTAEVEFTADHPGATLFHCHQQNHMDRGFMMVFRYA